MNDTHDMLCNAVSSAGRLLTIALMVVLTACAGSSQQAEIDQAETIAMQREQEQLAAARAAEERARVARQEAERERERQAELARQEREEAERQAQREEAARLAAAEQERRAAIARDEAQRARIAQLESQIEQLRASNAQSAIVNQKYEEAIAAAQALLDALSLEQQKYANTNAAGEPTVALDKARLADLEARKDRLKAEAQALAQ